MAPGKLKLHMWLAFVTCITFLFDNTGIDQSFSTKGDIAPRGHLAMCGDILVCHYWDSATGIYWVETRNAAKHPTIHTSAFYNKELAN